MAAELEVRAVKPDEYRRAGQVVVAAYRALGRSHLLGGYAGELADVERRAGEAEVLVAVDGDPGDPGDQDHAHHGIVGCVTVVPDPTSPWAEGLEDGEAGIRMLGVDPTWQRQGTGQLLRDACIHRAAAHGRTALFLHTTPWMTSAQRLYERNGFLRVEGRDFLPAADVRLLAYRRTIQPG